MTLALLSFNTFAQQWVYSKLGGEKIPALWQSLTNTRVVVAVIDTGVDYTHPDLINNIWINEAELNGEEGIDDDNNGYIDDIHGYNFADNTNDPMDTVPHGTHVAGIIAASHNNFGIDGINPNALIMPLKFMTRSGGTPQNAARAIRYAVDNGAQVINCSWGEHQETDELKEAVEYAIQNDIPIIASSGNAGINNDFKRHFPSHYPDVITVANIDQNGYITYRSNYGNRTVDIAAPGEEVLSTMPDNTYIEHSGTSMAAPFVSGAISLLLSLEPGIDREEITARLYRTGISTSNYLGKVKSGRRIDVYNFINNLEQEAPMPSNNWKRFDLETPIATPHPYRGGKWWSKRVVVPGAKFVRAHFKRVEFEPDNDYILLSGRDRKVYDKAANVEEDFYSSFIVGDMIVFNLFSDKLNSLWGFEVDYLEYQ